MPDVLAVRVDFGFAMVENKPAHHFRNKVKLQDGGVAPGED
jgi:hypothetical protein